MGARQSKPSARHGRQQQPSLLQPAGCIGLVRTDRDRLLKAPCLRYDYSAQTSAQLIKSTIDHIVSPPGGVDGIVGPICLFVARNLDARTIDAHLMFPSMTRDGEAVGMQHPFIGLSHRWLHRIINGDRFKVAHPQSSCEQGEAFSLGCVSDSGKCMQTKKEHKRMGVYARRKSRAAYADTYFRVYWIDVGHHAIAPSVSRTSPHRLLLNVLPSGVDMFAGCGHALISPTGARALVLRNDALLMHAGSCEQHGKGPVVASFRAGHHTRMVLEDDGHLRVYNSQVVGQPDDVVYEAPVVEEGSGVRPHTLVLRDDGSIAVLDARGHAAAVHRFGAAAGGVGAAQTSGSSVLGSGGSTFGVKQSGVVGDEYDERADLADRMQRLLAFIRSQW